MFALFPDLAELFRGGFSFVRSIVRREKRNREYLGKARRGEGKLYTVMLSSEVVGLSNQVIRLSIHLEDCRGEFRQLLVDSFDSECKCREKFVQKIEKLKDMTTMLLEQIRDPQERLIAHWHTILGDQNLLDLTEDITKGPASQD